MTQLVGRLLGLSRGPKRIALDTGDVLVQPALVFHQAGRPYSRTQIAPTSKTSGMHAMANQVLSILAVNPDPRVFRLS